ncbi:hypothetical protein BC628DRAFT_787078 [Trametes gibbosa]|nr:hypothetical protein BC628DRAFT_787078 [Trametes gibbosa]
MVPCALSEARFARSVGLAFCNLDQPSLAAPPSYSPDQKFSLAIHLYPRGHHHASAADSPCSDPVLLHQSTIAWAPSGKCFGRLIRSALETGRYWESVGPAFRQRSSLVDSWWPLAHMWGAQYSRAPVRGRNDRRLRAPTLLRMRVHQPHPARWRSIVWLWSTWCTYRIHNAPFLVVSTCLFGRADIGLSNAECTLKEASVACKLGQKSRRVWRISRICGLSAQRRVRRRRTQGRPIDGTRRAVLRSRSTR